MRRSRIAWGLVLLAVGSTAAWAEGLDKGSCNVLKAELAGLVGLGTRDDMERGPEWAKANLSDKKLQDIFRLIEVEEQLEFRCGMSHRRVAATAPAKIDRAVIPEPERKPQSKSSVTKSIPARAETARPLTDVVKTVAGTPAAQQPKAQKTAPPKTTAAVGPPAAKPASETASAAATPEAPGKSSRRESSAAYVSPSEVNPFFVTRYGDTQ